MSLIVNRYKVGRIRVPETPSSGHTPVHVYFHLIPDSLILPAASKAMTWTFITSVHSSQRVALEHFKTGIR